MEQFEEKGQPAFGLTLFCSHASANVVGIGVRNALLRGASVARKFSWTTLDVCRARPRRVVRLRSANDARRSGRLGGLLLFGPLFVHRVLDGFDGGGQFRFLALDEILGIIQNI